MEQNLKASIKPPITKVSVKKEPVKTIGPEIDLENGPPMATPLSEVEQEYKRSGRPEEKSKVSLVIDGKLLRAKRAASIGLSERILPPWTKNISAVYELLSNSRIDPATKEVPPPKDAVIEGTYVLYDPWESDPFKARKLMRNLGRPSIARNADSTERVEDRVEPIEFVLGKKVVDCNRDYRMYVFMELHPLNATNRNRPNDLAPEFKRIDINLHKSAASMAAELDLTQLAEKNISEMREKDKINGLAISFGLFQNGLDVSAIKNSLRIWVRNPANARKYFKQNNNPKPAMKLNILDAMTLGILDYREETQTFLISETGDRIFTHLIGKNGIDELVNHFCDPKHNDDYQILSQLIDYWE